MGVGKDVKVTGGLLHMASSWVLGMWNDCVTNCKITSALWEWYGNRSKYAITKTGWWQCLCRGLVDGMCITEIRNLLALNGRSVKGPPPHSQNRQESHAKTHFPMDVLHFYQNIKQKVFSCCLICTLRWLIRLSPSLYIYWTFAYLFY